MGDRTYCSLYVHGDLSEDRIKEIAEALNPDDQEENFFGFCEVNYGELERVDHGGFLKREDISFTWIWEAGGGYGSGVQLYNAETGEQAEFATIDGEIALTINQIENAEEIANAKSWNDWALQRMGQGS